MSRGEMAGGDEGGDITSLPEGCISHVISFTSPRDCCRVSAVSTTFRSASGSDTVWERFLPSDHEEILSQAVYEVEFQSKRDLYFYFCDSVLLDSGRLIFSLERPTGHKCYTLSARALGIVWGDSPEYWRWRGNEDSRFAEVAELLTVSRLEITGRIDCKLLSRRTHYSAYLIYKFGHDAYGFDHPNLEASVRVGSYFSESEVCLQPLSFWSYNQIQMCRRSPEFRSDWWLEMELGEFFSGDRDDGEVVMSLSDVNDGQVKNGLIIEGIEVRPM